MNRPWLSLSKKFVTALTNYTVGILGTRNLWMGFPAFLFPVSIASNMSISSDGKGTLREFLRRSGAAISCLVICLLLIGNMFYTGTQRKMDGRIYEAIDDATVAIAIAISDNIHGSKLGYIAYRPTLDALEKGGMTKKIELIENLGRKFPENLADRNLLNEAIRSALQITPPVGATFENRQLVSMLAMDPGVVDYDKLAFRIFGYRIESLYYLYFVVLSISVVIFIFAHRRNAAVLAVPILWLASGNIILTSSIFDNPDLFTVANVRFLTTLGILPAIHIAILMMLRSPPCRSQVALASIQIALFCFAISIRSSLVWAMMFIGCFAILQIASNFHLQLMPQKLLSKNTAFTLLRCGLWSPVLLLTCVWGYGSYKSATMHPSYELDDFLPHHFRYHNAFIGLTSNPAWGRRYAAQYGSLEADALGRRAAINYFTSHYDGTEEYFRSTLSGGDKVRLQDRMVRGAYFEFIRQHPLFVLEAHANKVRELFLRLESEIKSVAHNLSGLNSSFTLGSIAAAAIFAIGLPSISPPTLRVVAVCGMVMMFSWVPLIYTYVATQTLGEALWIGTMFFLVAMWGMICCVWEAVLSLWRKNEPI